jgi:four helix bundle protein
VDARHESAPAFADYRDLRVWQVAMGNGRVHRREYLHHLSIARGSLNELQTLVAIAERLGYVVASDLKQLAEPCDFVRRMLTA